MGVMAVMGVKEAKEAKGAKGAGAAAQPDGRVEWERYGVQGGEWIEWRGRHRHEVCPGQYVSIVCLRQ